MKTSYIPRGLAIAALAFIPSTGSASDQFTNGGFEAGFSGWEAGGNVSLQSTAPYKASEGQWLAAFNGVNSTPNGYLRKAVETVPGSRYRIEFDVGNLSYNALHQRLQVIVEDNAPVPPPPGARPPYVNDTIDIAGAGGGATAWITATYEFTAEQSNTRFVFNDVSTVTVSLDLVLDHIRLYLIEENPVLLSNGGFENDLAGWNSSGNLLIQTAAPYLPAEGRKLLAFNAGNRAPNGTLQQTVRVAAGLRYRLEFEVGNLSYNTLHQKLHVQVRETVNGIFDVYPVADNIDIPGSGGGSTTWIAASYDFVASTNSLELSFADISPVTEALDLVLDHVRLTRIFTEELIANGGFENDLAGWGYYSLSNIRIQTGPPYSPTEGVKLLSFNDHDRQPLAALSQTFSVVPGKRYKLEFDAGNLSYNNSPQQMLVTVSEHVGAVYYPRVEQLIQLTAPTIPGTTRWTRQIFHFTPQSDRATLVFDDLSTATTAVDMVLDHVSVVPDP